ncbi:hypothetical protein [Streptomyces incanus]|uniref:Uncharacterized protein n=1 Tax=Streptomyces incanus TaxID=887453 RepID=A0ABW0XHH0_9ACTN
MNTEVDQAKGTSGLQDREDQEGPGEHLPQSERQLHPLRYASGEGEMPAVRVLVPGDAPDAASGERATLRGRDPVRQPASTPVTGYPRPADLLGGADAPLPRPVRRHQERMFFRINDTPLAAGTFVRAGDRDSQGLHGGVG